MKTYTILYRTEDRNNFSILPAFNIKDEKVAIEKGHELFNNNANLAEIIIVFGEYLPVWQMTKEEYARI
jgi:hypothetical protein